MRYLFLRGYRVTTCRVYACRKSKFVARRKFLFPPSFLLVYIVYMNSLPFCMGGLGFAPNMCTRGFIDIYMKLLLPSLFAFFSERSRSETNFLIRRSRAKKFHSPVHNADTPVGICSSKNLKEEQQMNSVFFEKALSRCR